MKKTLISAFAAVAILLGGIAPAYAKTECTSNTCQATEQANNGFKAIGQGVEQAATGSYNTVKNGTVETYNKAKKGTKHAYRKAKKGTVKAYDKAKKGIVKQYDKTKKGLEEIF